jgi:hypothetical protein
VITTVVQLTVGTDFGHFTPSGQLVCVYYVAVVVGGICAALQSNNVVLCCRSCTCPVLPLLCAPVFYIVPSSSSREADGFTTLTAIAGEMLRYCQLRCGLQVLGRV